MLIVNFTASIAFANDLDDIIDGKHRSEENKERDEYRHPAKVLEFFGTQPNQHVLEMWPGNGWYSEILAPYVKDKGKYTAVTFAVDNLNSDDRKAAFWSKTALKYREKMSDKAIYGNVAFGEFEPPRKVELTKNNSVDVAYVVRVMHIWDEEGMLSQGLSSIYEALKPGGILAVIQHKGDEIQGIGSAAGEGYLGQNYVIEASEKVGFKFVESSDVNANPKDTKNYPKGVYSLPPMLAMGAKNKDKYMDIGESDRMTLKFIKPRS